MIPPSNPGALLDEPMADEAAPEGASEGNEFYLPDSFPGLDALKEGDSVTLTVLRRDEDGGVAVEPLAGEEAEAPKESWDNEVRRMAGPTQGY